MGSIGLPELLIVLAVVLLIFGVGRIARVGGELGKGVSVFRQGLRDDGDKDKGVVEKTEANGEPKA